MLLGLLLLLFWFGLVWFGGAGVWGVGRKRRRRGLSRFQQKEKKNDGIEKKREKNSFSLLPSLSLLFSRLRSAGSQTTTTSPSPPYLRPPVVDERPRVSRQPAHGAADVLVDLGDLFDARRDEQGRGDTLLGGEHDALLGAHADRGGAEL